MEIVFYRVGGYEGILKKVLAEYLEEQEIIGTFHTISNQEDRIYHEEGKEREYLIFYRGYISSEYEKARVFIKKNCICAKIIALCRDDIDGINAMGMGSDYAIRLPLKREAVIHCCRFFQSKQ